MPIRLQRHLNRCSTFYPEGDPAIPPALYTSTTVSCSMHPSRGIVWQGTKNGLFRYDPGARWDADRVLFFSATRDLPSNKVLALLPATPAGVNIYEALWVLTTKGAALLAMRWMSCEKKANQLLQESIDVVDRRGMFSQRWLARPRDLTSKLPYNESDNDGEFGCTFALAEWMHYAVLRRGYGPDDLEARRIKAIATRVSEAMLLLHYIHKRGDGFAARTYLAPHEPIPDGLFFRHLGDGTAQVVETAYARERGLAGKPVAAQAEIPQRLAHLYQDEGLGETGLVYKGDTSSDEVTLHFVHFYYLHMILGEEDPALRDLCVQTCKNLMGHILDHGCALHDAFGAPTTWARWSDEYFQSGFGWSDAPLNAIEILMYLRVTMAVTGETGRWREAYDALVAKGYPELGPLHAERLAQAAARAGMSTNQWMMYGDHMLATAAYWPLILLEPDEGLRELYRRGFASWRGSIAREHNPGYDIPYLLACPGAQVDMGQLEHWFYRSPLSRLAAPVSLELRGDISVRTYPDGYQETDKLLPSDERSIGKYDRNPYKYDIGAGSDRLVESCYPYTFAYWLGRYYEVVG